MTTPPAPPGPAPPGPPTPGPEPPAPAPPQPRPPADPPAPPNDPVPPPGPGLEAALRDERAQRAALQKQLDDERAAHMTEQEKALAKARAEGRKEAEAEAALRLAAAEFRFAATGRIADPTAALDLIDKSKLLGANGEPDPKAIAAAVERLAGPVQEPNAGPPLGHVPAGPRAPASAHNGDFIRGVLGGRRRG